MLFAYLLFSVHFLRLYLHFLSLRFRRGRKSSFFCRFSARRRARVLAVRSHIRNRSEGRCKLLAFAAAFSAGSWCEGCGLSSCAWGGFFWAYWRPPSLFPLWDGAIMRYNPSYIKQPILHLPHVFGPIGSCKSGIFPCIKYSKQKQACKMYFEGGFHVFTGILPH